MHGTSARIVPLPSLSLRRLCVVDVGLKDFDPMKMIIETTTFVFVGRIIIITLLCSKESSKTYNEELIIWMNIVWLAGWPLRGWEKRLTLRVPASKIIIKRHNRRRRRLFFMSSSGEAHSHNNSQPWIRALRSSADVVVVVVYAP